MAQACPTLCDPMDCSTPGLPVRHQLPELAQTHVHRVSDAIQPSHPLLSPSPPAFNLSQHQGLSLHSLHNPSCQQRRGCSFPAAVVKGYSLTALERRSPRSRCWKACFLPELLGKTVVKYPPSLSLPSTTPHPSADGGCRQSVASLLSRCYHAHLCFYSYIPF